MNKKNSLLTLIFFVAIFNVSAQTMVQNWLTKSNNAAITNSDDKPYFTHVDANGMIGIVGVSNNKVILATYDANGNDLWTNKYGSYSSETPIGLEKGPSGNFYFGCFWLGAIRKMTLSGGTAWTTNSSSYHGADFVVDANGDVYVMGADYARTTIYIDKILSNGTLVWTKTYTGYYGFGGQPMQLIMDHAGNLIMSVNATNSIGDRYISVAKFDTVGTNPNKIWHNVYSTTQGQAYDLVIDKTTNASYVTGSVNVGSFNQNDMIVYKSGPSGTINWSDVYNEANSDDKGCSLEQDASGNVYVLMDSHMPMTKYSVRKYTSAGAFVTSNGTTYQVNNVANLMPKIKIHPATNKIYFSGTKTNFSNNNMLVLYKTDLALSSIAQIYTYDHDVTDYDYSTSIDVDPTSQNLILTGNIFKTVTGNDYFYAKTDTLGNFIYSNIYNGVINGRDYATDIVTDASNLPVVVGATNSTLTGLDGFMVKYDAAGNEQWQSVFTGAGGFNDYLNAVDINTSGHYYAGGFTENGTNNPDMWIIKVDGNGSKLWDVSLQGTNIGGKDEVTDIFTDNFNNGYAAGYQYNNGTGQDAALIKFNSSGSILWSKKFTGSGNQKDAYRDIGSKNGNILYAVGYTTKTNGESDMLIVKYDNAGNLQWSRTYNSPQNGNDTAISVNVDANQNIAVVGSSDSAKVLTIKYDANGNLVWATSEPYITEVGPEVITTNSGLVFITCHWDSATAYANRVVCYNNSGVKLWHKDYSYGCCEHPMKMAKTSRGTIIVAPDFSGQIGAVELDTLGNERNNILTNVTVPYSDPAFGGTRNLTIDGNGDVYVTGFFTDESGTDVCTQKICYTPAPVVISGNSNVCYGATNVIYGVTTNTMVTGYNWTYPSGSNANITANNMSVNFGTAASGYVTVQQTNYCGAGNADSLFVNVLPLPNVSAGADKIICPGSATTLSGSGATTYTWNNGVTNGSSFNPAVSQNYVVTGADINGCANTDTVMIGLLVPPTPSICMATVDSLSTHNILYWDKTGIAGVSSFNIYREDITNNYTLIGSVPYDSLSEYHDYDMTMANPNVTTKRYKISAIDTCGNEGPKGNFHNTIFIAHSGGTFTWNTYTIQGQPNPVTSYALYRDTLANGNWQQIGTTAGTQNVLNDPNYATYQATADWRVETIWSISCSPTMRQGNNSNQTAIVKSKSNISNNRGTGIKNKTENIFTVYPNPTNGNLTINFKNNAGSKATIRVSSLLGEEVYNETINQASDTHSIDLSHVVSGVYLVQVTTHNTTTIKRIVKN